MPDIHKTDIERKVDGAVFLAESRPWFKRLDNYTAAKPETAPLTPVESECVKIVRFLQKKYLSPVKPSLRDLLQTLC